MIDSKHMVARTSPVRIEIYGIGVLLFLAVAYLFLQYKFFPRLEPYWLVLALFLPVIGLFVMRKCPALFPAALLFVGNFKNKRAEGISLSDPTMIVLLLCATTVFLDVLLAMIASDGMPLTERFTGQKKAVLSFVALLLMVVASFAYAPDPQLGLQKIEKLVVFDGLLFFTPLLIFKTDKDMRQFVRFVLILSLALAVRTAIGITHPPERMEGVDVTRISNGQMIGVTILILFYYRFMDRWARPVVLLSIPILLIGLMASAARGPILSTFMVLLACAIFLKPHNGVLSHRTIRVSFVATVVLAALSLTWLEQFPAAREKIKEKEQELTALAGGAQDPGGSATNRIWLYTRAFRAFTLKPILGWGVGGWIVFKTDDNQGPYPHNLFLEVGAELGIVGLLLLVNLLWNIAAGFWRLARSPDRRYDFLMPVLTFILLTSMFSGDLDNRLLWFWVGALFAGLRILLTDQKSQTAQDSLPSVVYA